MASAVYPLAAVAVLLLVVLVRVSVDL